MPCAPDRRSSPFRHGDRRRSSVRPATSWSEIARGTACEPALLASVGVHHPDVVAADERDLAPVGRPGRMAAPRRTCRCRRPPAVGVHDVEVEVAGVPRLLPREGDLPAVGRPERASSRACQLLLAAAVGVDDVEPGSSSPGESDPRPSGDHAGTTPPLVNLCSLLPSAFTTRRPRRRSWPVRRPGRKGAVSEPPLPAPVGVHDVKPALPPARRALREGDLRTRLRGARGNR